MRFLTLTTGFPHSLAAKTDIICRLPEAQHLFNPVAVETDLYGHQIGVLTSIQGIVNLADNSTSMPQFELFDWQSGEKISVEPICDMIR